MNKIRPESYSGLKINLTELNILFQCRMVSRHWDRYSDPVLLERILYTVAGQLHHIDQRVLPSSNRLLPVAPIPHNFVESTASCDSTRMRGPLRTKSLRRQ